VAICNQILTNYLVMTVTHSTLTDADVIINAVEINDRHGVGILLQRIFKDRSNTISIRTFNSYAGEYSFGAFDYLLGSIDLSRIDVFAKIDKVLFGHSIKRVLCIPYHVEEIFAALAIHELFGASICTYLMDDQNILIDGIPDELMSELLNKSALRLAISSEMRDAYQTKYRQTIYFAPPVIPKTLVNLEIPSQFVSIDPEVSKIEDRVFDRTYDLSGAIIGNIWSPQWLQLLRTMTREAGVKLDWYGNSGADWNMGDRSQLIADGITERGFLPTEPDVAKALRSHPYVVVPSGTLDERDDNHSTSWLSLPSRIPFVMATSNTPIIVVGSRNTAAARFVERLQIGTVADYDPVSFRTAVAYVTQPQTQLQMRQNATRQVEYFVNEQMDEWIWQSLAAGEPIDRRFAELDSDGNYAEAFVACLNLMKDYQSEIRLLKSRRNWLRRFPQYQRYRSRLRRVWLKWKGQL
jgi:hypothetical protein